MAPNPKILVRIQKQCLLLDIILYGRLMLSGGDGSCSIRSAPFPMIRGELRVEAEQGSVGRKKIVDHGTLGPATHLVQRQND